MTQILLISHVDLSNITGVNIILSNLLQLIPSIDPSIEVKYESLEECMVHHTLGEFPESSDIVPSCVIGVNLHIEKYFEASDLIFAYYKTLNLCTYLYIHDYWPHHYHYTQSLIDKYHIGLLSSSKHIQNLLRLNGFESKLVQVGIALNNINTDRSNAHSPSKESAERGKYIIASTGRLVPRKRFTDVIQTFMDTQLYNYANLYLRLFPSKVYSENEDRKRLNKLKELIGADRGVHNSILIDHKPTEKHDYTKYDVYVCASDYEGFSMTPIESAYSGCPPIMSDIPPHRQIAETLFQDRSADFLYPVYDYKKLGLILRDEITHGARKRFLSSHQKAIQRVIEESYSLKHTAIGIINLL